MNGNPLYHWIGLAVSTALMLPVPVAMLAGWTPPWMRKRQAGMRLRAYGFLCVYALTLINSIARIADASFETVRACMYVGFAFGAAGAVLFLLAERKDSRAQAAGLVESMRSQH
ncbi:hypothetical protein [Streptomyces sp. NBC_01618]|uniref:hypothetical protein n=1 Tax=Streptomyces sp. NBC_01618 TaxID=2975900 RepID=UPI003868077C|nr:hypothetical protein OH735_34750 [Streptomyces sp. NBC_01618]